jgi:hypothetical protein
MNKLRLIAIVLHLGSILCARHDLHAGIPSGLLFANSQGDTVQNVNMMFFVQHGRDNTMDLYNHPVFKNIGADFAFVPSGPLPDGFLLSEEGILSWSPSAAQFAQLQKEAGKVGFVASSLTGTQFVAGEIRIVAEGQLTEPLVETSVEQPDVVVEDPEADTTAVPLAFHLPDREGWDFKKEGESFSFELIPSGGSGNYTFELISPAFLMSNLDKYGQFSWTPPFDFVQREEEMKDQALKIKLFDDAGNDTIRTVVLHIQHVNRPPEVNPLPVFYIQYDKSNTYNLKETGLIEDPDGDSIIFRPVLKELPQNMQLGAAGIITWKPSVSQFHKLRSNPLELTFTVEDYPAGLKSIGQLRVLVSQQDLPPQVTMVPNQETFEIEEDQTLKLNFFVSDPNGVEDLLAFSFVSENSFLTNENLVKQDEGHYAFEWTPGYDFIQEEGGKDIFNINFFAIDKENNRTEKTVEVTVNDTENLLEKDRILYDQYRTTLERAWDLIKQLDEKESELEKEYKRAKNGKKNRAIGTASVGALTGLSPVVFMENPSGQKVLAGVGGTATATIGTLEASNVIGESPSDVMRSLSSVAQKKNDLLVYGNIFASKYALPLDRRDKGFANDLKSLTIQLNLKDIHQLQLDAGWENPDDASDKNIRKVFKDFNPDPRFVEHYK